MLPLLHREVADKRAWATIEEITDYYAIAQCLPGIIAIKASALIGYKHSGAIGSIAAALGVAFPAVVASLIIAVTIDQLMEFELVAHIFNGVRVAVLALVIDATIKMWKSGVKDLIGAIIFSVALAAFILLGISPVIPVIAGGIFGLVVRHNLRERSDL
ncbi:MAG: chromate transporter [Defluviitaleaceae bacterium]|nr:chromate transporter [Defluviitaleaceae bacterium]